MERVERIRAQAPGSPSLVTIGYLRHYRGTLRGSRETVRFQVIHDARDTVAGYINAEGRIYRYVEGGKAVEAAWDDVDRGLSKFFDLPPGSRVVREPVSTYE